MQLNFNAATVDPATAFEPVPAGWYTAVISKSEQTPVANSNTGAYYLTLEMTIQEPVEAKGRKLFDRLNLKNDNPIAQEIAWKTLSAICHATNQIQLAESAQLHDKPLQVKVSLVPAGPGNDGKFYEAKNEVKGYKAVTGNQPVQTANALIQSANAIPPAIQPAGAPLTAAVPPPIAQAPAPVPVAVPVPPAPTPAPVVAEVFPPEGWLAHPTSAGWFYKGQEVLNEEQLRAKFAAPAIPSAPATTAPVQTPTAAASPAASPAPAEGGSPIPPWAQKPAG